MSLEKPNAGKPVELSEGFLIKQYHGTILLLKLAYPTENLFSSNTSRFLTNLLAEILDNPFGSYSTPICPRNPSVCPIWTVSASPSPALALRQPQEAPRQLSEPLRQLRWPLWCSTQHLTTSTWPCVNTGCSCVSLSGCSAAIPILSLPLYLSVLSAPQLLSQSLILSLLANPTLENRMTDHSGVFSKWPSSLLLYFSFWHLNGRD